jgi:molybdenum cofactor cytidylyltransferase
VKFGTVPIAEAIGAIAVHGVQQGGVILRKGEIVTAAAAAALFRAGAQDLVAARLEPGDIGENEAARCLADAVRGPHLRADQPFTGRCNLHATVAGVLTVDRAAIDRINTVDEAITLATLPPFKAVVAGEMVATVKIIPFAVPGVALDAAIAAVRDQPLAVAPFRPLRVGVVSTLLPSLKESVIAKTLRVMAERLAPAGATIALEMRVAHTADDVAAALRRAARECDLTVVFGASAITDRRDVIPAGLVAAGGRIDHFGMPVDPGNLLLLGALEDKPVLGAPGCARSPKENGFDWVLHRLLAGLPVTATDIRGLGGGGLLMEIVSRPQPRSGGPAVAIGDEDLA